MGIPAAFHLFLLFCGCGLLHNRTESLAFDFSWEENSKYWDSDVESLLVIICTPDASQATSQGVPAA